MIEEELKLIKYEQRNNRGPICESYYLLDYLSMEKTIKININSKANGGGKEVFETEIKPITISTENLLKLKNIKDFDNLELPGS